MNHHTIKWVILNLIFAIMTVPVFFFVSFMVSNFMFVAPSTSDKLIGYGVAFIWMVIIVSSNRYMSKKRYNE